MTLVPRLREAVARRSARLPAVTRLWPSIENIGTRTGLKIRPEKGRTRRSSARRHRVRSDDALQLDCEFCYVGDLLNIEGEWRRSCRSRPCKRAFPDQDGLQVSLTGGEIFMRKDILA
jgi:hypothetical protein